MDMALKNRLAAEAMARFMHRGQVDKAGADYFEHLVRVAHAVTGNRDMAVAYLHDIIEDTDMTASELRLFFPIEIVEDVITLTREENESYGDYIERVASGSFTALKVKLADLDDHLRTRENIPASLVRRYEAAKERLSHAARQHVTSYRAKGYRTGPESDVADD